MFKKTNSKIIHFISTILTLVSSESYAQSLAFKGVAFTGLENEPVHVVRPIAGGYLNYFYTATSPTASVRQGQVQVSFSPNVRGELVSIQTKNLSSCFAFVEPGAPIVLRQVGAGFNKGSLFFEGPNAAGNNLLLTGQLLNRPAGVDKERVRVAIAAGSTAGAILHNLKGLLNISMTRLDSVRNQHLISTGCYASLRAQTEQSLLHWTNSLLAAYEDPENRPKLNFQVSEVDLRRVLKSMMADYDPYAPRYHGQFITLVTAQEKYVFQAKNWFASPQPHRYWNRYATKFNDTNSTFANIDYAPAAQQGLLIGNELLTALALRPMSEADFAIVFQDFVQHFPNSPYISVITQALLQEHTIIANEQGVANSNSNQDLGYYDSVTSQLTFSPVSGIDTVSSITALVRRQFSGKPVFIDFWATWCAPCIAEFHYEAELYTFLEKNGITVLYVSINNANFRTKWREFIVQNKLRGSHYLANATVQKSLEPLLERGIPRYVLFDAHGHLVDNDLPLPSTGEKFHQRILQKLSAK